MASTSWRYPWGEEKEMETQRIKKGPWAHQEYMQKQYELPCREDVLEGIRKIKDIRNKALVALLYLTAGRISEIRGSVIKSNFKIEKVGGKEINVLNMPNRKHRKLHRKNIPLYLDELEKDIFEEVKLYLKAMPDHIPLFPIKKSQAYDIIRNLTEYNPHFWRHIRLSHLVMVHNYNEQQLRIFAGWTDGRPCKHYMEMDWRILVKS